MANATWPTLLPDIQYPAPEDGYNRQAQNQAIRSAMDAGPPKQRRRFSAGMVPVSLNVEMTAAQVAIFEDFYYNTLQVVLPFDWIDHFDRTTATYVFVAPPIYAPLAADFWSVSLALEMQP